jgi:hypothetical protein
LIFKVLDVFKTKQEISKSELCKIFEGEIDAQKLNNGVLRFNEQNSLVPANGAVEVLLRFGREKMSIDFEEIKRLIISSKIVK